MDTLWNTIWILLTAIVWGCTNPFIRKGAHGIDKVSNQDTDFSLRTKFIKTLSEIQWCLVNWRLTVPLLINQSGSILFYYSLSQLDLSLVVPLTNSLTTVITALTGRFLGEEKTEHNTMNYIGMIFVCVGASLCIVGKT